jgi:starvation-inducible DNA-binding protein
MQNTLGIKEENVAKTVALLNIFLADEFILYTKTKNAHWNVEGADFYDKHSFFEMQFAELDIMIDSLAERIRTIGHFANATLRQYLQTSHLSEKTDNKNDGRSFAKTLLSDHESIIIHYRENITRMANEFHDHGTSDFITGIMERHEKMAWMLRAQLR